MGRVRSCWNEFETVIAGEAGPIARIGKAQSFRDRRCAERICQFWLCGQNRLLSTSQLVPLGARST